MPFTSEGEVEVLVEVCVWDSPPDTWEEQVSQHLTDTLAAVCDGPVPLSGTMPFVRSIRVVDMESSAPIPVSRARFRMLPYGLYVDDADEEYIDQEGGERPLAAAEALQLPHRTLEVGRLVLLHGPPGCGKTSVARALAHKLAIRQSSRYVEARLFTINAHSLFSKWFSESGKLVGRLFGAIREAASDKDVLCCVLIDEVESISHS
ncbi:hypothetical protein KIPB_008700, partial [Kipferlia bialata]|eukprot:g8700.t1